MGALRRFASLAILCAVVTLGAAQAFAQTTAKSTTDTIRIVAFGDSLTAGFQLRPAESFPAQLQAALRAKGHAVEIINAGVSGDTTSAGLSRIDWAVPADAHGVILELGANDALQGRDPKDTRRVLNEIIARLKKQGVEILLAGMAAPRNLGEDYTSRFDRIFPDLAAEHALMLYPFFLEGVALNGSLNLSDGMHPNAKGVAVIVERITPKVLELMERVRMKRSGSKS